MNARVALTAGLLACLATFAGLVAADDAERDACVKEAATYLAAADIAGPVQRLVGVSRIYYPDVLQLIEDEIPVPEYETMLRKLGRQTGCDKIEEHVQVITNKVPCYAAMDEDEEGMLSIARDSEDAKRVVEAYFACVFSKKD